MQVAHDSGLFPEAPDAVAAVDAGVLVADAGAAFDKRDWTVVGLSLAQAVLWVAVFDPWASPLYFGAHGPFVPGFGITVLTLVGFACAYGLCFKRLRITAPTLALNIATALLALSFSLNADDGLRAWNMVALWLVGTFTLVVTCGIWQEGWASLRAFAYSQRFFFRSLFANIFKPLGAVAVVVRERSSAGLGDVQRPSRGICMGICAAALALMLVVPLLASADAVYASLFTDALDSMWDSLNLVFSKRACAHVIMFMVAAPLLFSLLYGTIHAQDCPQPGAQTKSDGFAETVKPFTAVVVLAAVDAFYLLFVCIQFVYLFGGVEAPAMHGGYAEYARNGFFQLVTVAVINVALALLASKSVAAHVEGRVALRVLTVVLVACTGVMLASALWRMGLYIGEFGLSYKRLATLFLMAFCAVMLVAVLVKLFRAKMGFFRVFFSTALVIWIAFTYVNPNMLVANYNTRMYLSGQLQEIDIFYLNTLGPYGVPALERLAAEAQPDTARLASSFLKDYAYGKGVSWQFWSVPMYLASGSTGR